MGLENVLLQQSPRHDPLGRVLVKRTILLENYVSQQSELLFVVFFLSSSSVQRWTAELMHTATKMECGGEGGAYAMNIGLQNDQENQDLKGDDISMLLFIKTLFSNKKIALFKYEYYSLLFWVRK